MRKKKVVSLGLALACAGMIISGCGAAGASQTSETTAEAKVELKTTETTETSGATAVTDNAETAGNSTNDAGANETEGEGMGDYIPVMPYITIEKKTSNVSAEGQGILYVTSYCTLKADGGVEDYSALNEALQSYSNENLSSVDNMKSQFDGFFADNPTVKADEGYAEEIPYLAYSIHETPGRIDEKMTSIREEIYLNSGAAYPQILYKGYTFDNKTGQSLSLADVVTDEATFLEFARERIINSLNDRGLNEDTGLNSDYADTVNAFDGSEHNWFFNAGGLEIVFSADTLAPRALGEIEVTINYEEITPYINSDYLPSGDMIAYVPQNVPACASLVQGEYITLKTEDGADYSSKVSLKMDAVTKDISEKCFGSECYLINRCEKSYMIVNVEENENLFWKMYDVDDNLNEIISKDGESFDSTLIDLDKIECRSAEDSTKVTVYRFGAELPQ